MTEQIIQYGRVDYVQEGKRIGQRFQLSYKPEISGPIVGYNATEDQWLVKLDVPYGEKSKVYSVLSEKFLQAVEDRDKG